MGEVVGGTIVFCEADAEPLLGVNALVSNEHQIKTKAIVTHKRDCALSSVCPSRPDDQVEVFTNSYRSKNNFQGRRPIPECEASLTDTTVLLTVW